VLVSRILSPQSWMQALLWTIVIRGQVWWQSSHLSGRRSDLHKKFTDGWMDGRTDIQTTDTVWLYYWNELKTVQLNKHWACVCVCVCAMYMPSSTVLACDYKINTCQCARVRQKPTSTCMGRNNIHVTTLSKCHLTTLILITHLYSVSVGSNMIYANDFSVH